MNKIWVVEMLNDETFKWEATIGVGLTKLDAKNDELQQWQKNNPNDKFRVTKYIAAVTERGKG